MKTLLLTSIMMTATIVANSQTTQQDSLIKNLTSKKASSESSINADWLSAAQHNIASGEYFFKKKHISAKDIFYTVNDQQKTGFIINSLGYSVSTLQLSAKASANNWKEEISFNSIQKGNNIVLLKDVAGIEEGTTKMGYHYNNVSIEYINNIQGLRQNFIINHKPTGQGNVKLALNINGNLSPKVKNNQLQFENKDGIAMLYYRDLNVWDATHKALAANMALNGNNELVINIDDRNATYPVTIDPISQTPEWTGKATGILPSLIGQSAIDAAYGFSVAGVGDVNGDGYDDVAIGAPSMANFISGTGTLASVGAVFVYYGSANGLAATPSAMLQPTTSVAGALFGYSIAGGDVNKDGKSDIIVGAPMDNVTISTGGASTASGTIGKVYVFNGATLSTSTTPLITLQLSGTGILQKENISVNALFGFSVAVTEDLNGDGKKDIIVGAPTYAGIKAGLLGTSIADVQSGGAFVFLSNATDNTKTIVSLTAPQSDILGIGLLGSNINGLLFGYSVDGLGDYNGDGKSDVIATAPAGINLSSVNALLNGKLLQGSAMVYYGTGSGVASNTGATLTATSGGLLTNLTGTVANIANLFGTSVKGVRNAVGARTGNVLVGAPLGGVAVNVLSLQLKTGTVSLFKKKASSPSGSVAPDQVLSSPRNTSTILGLIQSNLLFGYSIDNTLDVNCDGIADIVIGEPASSGAQLVNANIAGGAAYVYLGNADGTYQNAPVWTLTVNTDAFLGVNAASLTGYSVAGAGYVKGLAFGPRVMAGSPAKTLDFSSGLLNLGNTFGTLFGLVAGNNGIGEADVFDTKLCQLQLNVLPVSLTQLKAEYVNSSSHITWSTEQENNTASFEIEHSTDGVNFTSIGEVKAAGNSNTKINYEFTDTKVQEGNNYYRLKIINLNAIATSSNIVLLKVAIKGITVTNVYPSPFTDKINVDISSENSALVNIKLVDLTGQAITGRTFAVNQGSSVVTIAGLGDLSKGLYLIQVQCGAKTITQKLLKQ